MGLRARILRAVHPDGGGPRPRGLLVAMAKTEREKDHAEDIVDALIGCGALVKYGDRRGAKWGLPK